MSKMKMQNKKHHTSLKIENTFREKKRPGNAQCTMFAFVFVCGGWKLLCFGFALVCFFLSSSSFRLVFKARSPGSSTRGAGCFSESRVRVACAKAKLLVLRKATKNKQKKPANKEGKHPARPQELFLGVYVSHDLEIFGVY